MAVAGARKRLRLTLARAEGDLDVLDTASTTELISDLGLVGPGANLIHLGLIHRILNEASHGASRHGPGAGFGEHTWSGGEHSINVENDDCETDAAVRAVHMVSEEKLLNND